MRSIVYADETWDFLSRVGENIKLPRSDIKVSYFF